MNFGRCLVVTADDFGIGPAVTRGILDLAEHGAVTASVLLVNSPYAEPAVRAWKRAGERLELGWHPCLTLDRPILPPAQVPSLVDGRGRFFPLGTFLTRLAQRRLDGGEIEAELRAQYWRFQELVGRLPTLVNGHHHVHVFPVVGNIVRQILSEQVPLPYLRRVTEPWATLVQIAGGRCKRALLVLTGQFAAGRQQSLGFPGNDYLAGITSATVAEGPECFTRWLRCMPGQVVELVCHPGYPDRTLLGRDAVSGAELQRRFLELQRLQECAFRETAGQAGFTLVSPHELAGQAPGSTSHAA